jgi:hypothetical protein
MWGPHACAVMPWGGGDCTLGLAGGVAIMMPLQAASKTSCSVMFLLDVFL